MIEIVLLTALLGKLKHYKLRYLFRAWSFYPVLITQTILVFLQGSIFLGYYGFVQYASLIKTATILSFLFPLLSFRLYRPALLGSGAIVLGTLLNRLAIAQNSGKMPVFPSLSYWTGYVKPGTFDAVHDIHVLGSAGTNLKFLTDYIDLGYSILSPGDLLIHFLPFLMLYSLLEQVNLQYNPHCDQIKYGGQDV